MSVSLMHETDQVVEGRIIHLAERPFSFEEFLEISGYKDHLELVKGVLVERMSARLPHERHFGWVFWLLEGFVEQRSLGEVLGSRTAVRIDAFGGRLPDVLFVRQDRRHIIQDKAVYGAPDLVVEIICPNDRPSDVHALETDYRNIGVAEIIFLDLPKRRVLVVRRRDDDYQIETLSTGTLHFETVSGFHLEVEALFQDPLPRKLDILTALLAEDAPA